MRIRRATVFAIAFLMPLWMALEGGAYDIVIRQEIAMLIWLLVAMGAVIGFLPRTRGDVRALLPLAVLGALFAFNVLSLAWSGSAERTVDEIARVALYAGVVTLALFSVNRYTWRAAAAGLSAALGVVVVIAVASRLFPGLIESANEIGSDRLYYPFGYWNAVSCWGAMAIASGLAWSAHARSGVLRGLALASVPFAAVAVYLAYSRGGVVAAGIAIFAAVLFAHNRWTTALHATVAAVASAVSILVVRGQPEIADGIGGAGGGTVLAVLIAAGIGCAAFALGSQAAGSDRLRLPPAATIASALAASVILITGLIVGSGQISEVVDEFKEGGNPATTAGGDPAGRLSSAGSSRYDYWDAGLDAFAGAKLGGIGPGTYEFHWAEHSTIPEFVVDAHSLYIEQLAELGIVGLLLLVGFIGALIAAAAAARRSRERIGGAEAAMLAVFAVWLLYAGIDWMWEVPAITAVALAAIAVAIGGGSARRRRPPTRLLRIGLVALALAAIAIQVPGIVGNQRSRAAESARLAGDYDTAVALASEAIDAAPWAATPRHVRALAELDAGMLDRADADILEAIDREPDNRWHWLVATRIAIARKDGAEASERLRTALRLNGKLPLLGRLSPIRVELEAQVAELQ